MPAAAAPLGAASPFGAAVAAAPAFGCPAAAGPFGGGAVPPPAAAPGPFQFGGAAQTPSGAAFQFGASQVSDISKRDARSNAVLNS